MREPIIGVQNSIAISTLFNYQITGVRAFIDKFRHMIDILVGDEVNFPGKLSVDLFHEAREAGLDSI